MGGEQAPSHFAVEGGFSVNMGLAELGSEIARETHQRLNELENLYSLTIAEIKQNRESGRQEVRHDLAERREKLHQIFIPDRQMLIHYRKELQTLAHALREDQVSIQQELQTWVKDGENEVKAWHEALQRTPQKRGRR